jgi:hypothetical protein
MIQLKFFDQFLIDYILIADIKFVPKRSERSERSAGLVVCIFPCAIQKIRPFGLLIFEIFWI